MASFQYFPIMSRTLTVSALVVSMQMFTHISSCDARIVLAESLQSSPTIPGASLYEWTLDEDLSDEFQGNDNKWSRSLAGWTGSPPGYFQNSNAFVADGKLNLVAKSPSCSKLNRTGAFHGQIIQTISQSNAPSQTGWTWAACAKECTYHTSCAYWLVSASKGCVLKKTAERYQADIPSIVAHGFRDEDCRSESFAASAFGATGDCNCGYSSEITTGMVVSKKAATFGFYEVSATIGRGKVMTSFWLQGFAGEINIFESITSQQQQQHLATNMHCFDIAGDGSSTKSMEELVAKDFIAKLDYSVPHTFGLDWTSEHLKFYIDGILVRTITKRSVGNDKCMNDPMNVVLSMETVSRHGIPEQGFAEVVSKIHYFRRFKRGNLVSSTTAPQDGNDVSPLHCTNRCAKKRGARMIGTKTTSTNQNPLAQLQELTSNGKTRRHADNSAPRPMSLKASKVPNGFVDTDASMMTEVQGKSRRNTQARTHHESNGGRNVITKIAFSQSLAAIVAIALVVSGMVAIVTIAKKSRQDGETIELDSISPSSTPVTPRSVHDTIEYRSNLRRRSSFISVGHADRRRSRCSIGNGSGNYWRKSSISGSSPAGLADTATVVASQGIRRVSQFGIVHLAPLVTLDETLCAHNV